MISNFNKTTLFKFKHTLCLFGVHQTLNKIKIYHIFIISHSYCVLIYILLSNEFLKRY